MSLKLTLKGGPATPNALSGLDQLKHSSADDAAQILGQLRDEFRNKSGVVRLMHTSKANRFMKFSDAGGFKQIFISGSKLQRTGEVIAKLMEQSGKFSDDQIKAFRKYAADRGQTGIESRELATYLAPLGGPVADGVNESEQLLPPAIRQSQQPAGKLVQLKQSTFSTTDDALKALGVTGQAAANAELGHGGQGSVSKVMLNGQPYVLKTLTKAETVGLAGPDGKMIEREPEIAGRSYETASVNSNPGNKGLLLHKQGEADSVYNKHRPAGLKNSYMRSSVPKSESESSRALSDAYNNIGAAFSGSSVVSNDEQDIAFQQASHDSKPHENLAKQPELPQQSAINPQPELDPPPLINPQPEALDGAKPDIKLARTLGIGSVARMKDLDQVVQPSHYLITETTANDNNRVHVVEGGRALKDWAKTQATDSSFEVTQYLMPLAAGQPLMKLNQDATTEKNFKREDLPAVARSMTGLLEQMWRHGFVDGDIKPENLMWDASSKTLRAIDIDSFQKVSKKPGSALPKSGVLTYEYAHPEVLRNRTPVTLGRDLFSAGVVMLEAALRANGHEQEADSVTLIGNSKARIAYLRVTRASSLPETLDNMKTQLNFADGGVEDFAILCIKTSLDYEKQRVANGVDRFERYDEQAGPNHPMSILKQHPLISQAQ